jgi:DNA modification methylase
MHPTATATLHKGDCLDALRRLPAGSVDCCVTSPPYYGLRDYGVAGQIGLEKTPAEYVARLVAVFGEVRRVLSDRGTLWLNLGDSYATGGGAVGRAPGGGDQGERFIRGGMINTQPNRMPLPGLKPKDLIGIPWRVAFALQADGWYLRSEVIWHKPNPMPESVRDRPTKSHEQVFLLSKAGRYHYDADAVREAASQPAGLPRLTGQKKQSGANAGGRYQSDLRSSHLGTNQGNPWRNRRSVWTVATKPCPEAHFAVMPEKLVEPCILAGCPAGGTVLDPFTGAGTVGLVAVRHGRAFVGVELNPSYLKIARRRIAAAPTPTPLPASA